MERQPPRGGNEKTHHLKPLRSRAPCIELACKLNFTRPSIFWRPSRLWIELPSARSSRKCRKHSSSGVISAVTMCQYTQRISGSEPTAKRVDIVAADIKTFKVA